MSVSESIKKYYPEYYGWFDYPADKTISFCEVAGEWGLLGNFGHSPLIVDSVPFYAVESLFQVMKFSDLEARQAIYSVKGQGLKMKAKHYEKAVGAREDWGENIVDALKFCLMRKYEQCAAFRDCLARTGDKYIVEDQNNFRKPADTYGAKLSPDGLTWSGPNLMGRLLMELRDNGKLVYSLPESYLFFLDLL